MRVFDEYIKGGNPSQREKAYAWKTAIGLQDVDGLKPSAFLVQTAKQNIEGDITIEEAKQLIDSYYQSSSTRHDVRYERTKGSDKVSATDADSAQSANETVQSANSALYHLLKGHNCTLEEAAVLRVVQLKPTATQKEIAAEIGKSERTVKTLTVALQEKGILKRTGSKRNGKWEIMMPKLQVAENLEVTKSASVMHQFVSSPEAIVSSLSFTHIREIMSPLIKRQKDRNAGNNLESLI